MMSTLRRTVTGVLSMSAAATILSFAVTAANAQTASTQKQQAIALVSAFETGDDAALTAIDASRYVEHDLSVASGIEGLKAAIKSSAKSGAKRRVVRVLEDGNHVVAHVEQITGGKSYAAFDVYRFENGKIVEHWNNVQPVGKPNPSGRTLLDGTTDISASADVANTKKVAGDFVREVLKDRQLDKFASYVDGENYIQHNPMFGDGLKAVTEGFRKAIDAGLVFKLDTIHEVLGEGNFAFIMGEGSINGKPTAFFDLFRVEGQYLAEHWDVIQDIPAASEHKNGNGKF